MADAQFELLWNLSAPAFDAPNRRGAGTSSVAVVDSGAWPLGDVARCIYLKRQQAFFCRPAWNTFRRTPTLRHIRLLSELRISAKSKGSLLGWMAGFSKATAWYESFIVVAATDAPSPA